MRRRRGVRFDFEVAWDEQLVGGAAIDAAGEALPAATLEACEQADAVLLGAVVVPAGTTRPLRRGRGCPARLGSALELFANLRRSTAHPALDGTSPLRP